MTRAASSESPVARRILIGVGLLFLALFLALPLVVVFVQAFAKGWPMFVDAIGQSDARAESAYA